MRQILSALVLSFVCLSTCHAASPKANPKAKPLQIYFIDVEGGQATLIVSPSGESLLIDTGWPDNEGRDSDRIVAAAHNAGIKQIDYVLITHYHRDHVGGVPQLVGGIKIGTFVDHGANQEDSEVTHTDYAAYEKGASGHPRMTVKPGWGLPIKGIQVRVLSAAGDVIDTPLPGAGRANTYCGAEPPAPTDDTENARSVGLLVTYGRFRFLDLGDLTKKKELALVCPNNLIGGVDLFLVTHHGADLSNSKALVWALHPQVAVIDNGPRKGSSQAAWQTVHDAPGLEDLWQLHYAEESDKLHNVDADHIANVKEHCEGAFLKVSAESDGAYALTNSRTGFTKSYSNREPDAPTQK